MSRVLDKGNDKSSTNTIDNNTGVGAGDSSSTADVGDTSGTRDIIGINGIDNNFDSKNAYSRASFSIYNIVDVHMDTDIGDITSTKDVDDTDGVDNNINSKNAYTKACFSPYNIMGANTDAGADVGDTSDTCEKGSNNINNTCKS